MLVLIKTGIFAMHVTLLRVISIELIYSKDHGLLSSAPHDRNKNKAVALVVFTVCIQLF